MRENNTCEYTQIKDYKNAFECFKQRFLIDKKSIFRLDSKDEILNKDSVQFLVDNFIGRGLGGDANFIDKIKMQLIGDDNLKPLYPDDTNNDDSKETIQKNAIEVLAHCVWLWRLVPANGLQSSTIKSVQEVLNLNDNLKTISLDKDNNFFSEKIKGIVGTGTYYNTNKPLEIAFVVKFLEKYLEKQSEQKENNNNEVRFVEILLSLKDNEKYGQVTITTAKDKNGKLLVLNKGNEDIQQNSNEKGSTTKSAAIFHAMLHFFDSKKYEAIVSMEHKQVIVKTFKDLIVQEDNDSKKEFKPEIDWKLHCIKGNLINELDLKEEEITFYHKKIERLWRTQELNLFKNIIYHGAPGTGKTYELKKEIEEHLELYDGGKFEFVQFHGAYTYEDFIGGLRPDIQSKNGLNLKYQNGIFKQLCKEAAKYEIAYYNETKTNTKLPTKLEDSTILKENLTITVDDDDKEFIIKPKIPILSQFPPFFILIDEINRADLSKVFGELLFAIEDDYRGFENRFKLSYSAMETEDTAVYWDNTNNEAFFFVPKNLYIRGTMNDIDRSVDSIDFAFRRRFKWVEKKYNPDILQDILEKESYDIDKYIKSCDNLNKEILKISIADESFQIGHAIFRNIIKYTKSKKITQESKRELFDNHIESIIYNYLKMDYGNESQNVDNFRKVFID